jgi:hypothetical protein
VHWCASERESYVVDGSGRRCTEQTPDLIQIGWTRQAAGSLYDGALSDGVGVGAAMGRGR